LYFVDYPTNRNIC